MGNVENHRQELQRLKRDNDMLVKQILVCSRAQLQFQSKGCPPPPPPPPPPHPGLQRAKASYPNQDYRSGANAVLKDETEAERAKQLRRLYLEAGIADTLKVGASGTK